MTNVLTFFPPDWGMLRAVLMGTKSCTKILNFSTRFSCENLAVEDFVTLLMGKKSCWWGNVMFGHNFGILVMLFYAGEIQIQTHWKGNVFFPNTGWGLQEQTKLYLYSTATSEAQTPTYVCGGFTLGVIVGRWTQAQPGKNALLQSFL